MPLAHRVLLSIACAATFVWGCARAGDGRPEVSAPQESRPAGAPRAQWAFHPLEKAATTDRVEFPHGVVEVDGAGSRWWHPAGGGGPEVSPFGAPEPLAAVLRAGNRLASVGESGAVYLSDEPLSPFVEVRTPGERFVTTTRSGDVLIAVSRGGIIHRSESAGKHWTAALGDQFFVDVESSRKGELLAYSVPEQWHVSSDRAATFLLAELPTQAPRRLVRSPEGEILVEGLYGVSAYRDGTLKPDESGALRQRAMDRERASYKLPAFAKASEVVAGRAALVGTKYVGLEPGLPGKPWKLALGGLDSAVEKKEVEGLETCARFTMVSASGHSAVLCQESGKEVSPKIKVYRSKELGAPYRSLPRVFRGRLSQVLVAQSRAGDIAIAGLCAKAEKGCSASGVQVIRAEGELEELHVPGVEQPDALGFDSAGTLWLAGRRQKDGHFVLFRADSSGGVLFDATREGLFPALVSDDASFDLAILPGTRGITTLSLLVSGNGYLVSVDRQGKLFARGTSPPSIEALHGFGERLVALRAREGFLFESTTAGLSWKRHDLPRALCPRSSNECDLALVCSEGGCLVGDELSRLGWGDHEGDRSPALPSDAVSDGARSEPFGFECAVQEGQWTPLDGMREIPDASHAALGETSWGQVLEFPGGAGLTSVSVKLGSDTIQREVLFSPVQDASEYSFYVAPQVEGTAAVRYRLPGRSSALRSLSATANLTVEVAWTNHIAGIVGGATFEQPMGSPSGSFSALSLLRSTDPELLSVAGQGLYLKLSPRLGPQPTLFFTGRGKHAHREELASVNWPSADAPGAYLDEPFLQATARYERVRIDGGHGALAQFANGRILSVATGLDASGDPKSVDSYLMGLLAADAIGYAQSVSISYLGQDVGYVSLQIDLDGSGHRASFVQLGGKSGFLPPVRVPLQQDIDGPPRPCSAEQRRETPRVLAPPVIGSPRRVTISGVANDVIELSTQNAVLHGTVEKPCVAVMDASETSRSSFEENRYFALIFPDRGGGASWLFRVNRDRTGTTLLAARPLSCQLED